MSAFEISKVENAAPFIDARRYGTVITIKTVDVSVNDVIDAGFDRIVVERSTDGGISFEEVTKPSERPLLEKNKVAYTWRDRSGSENFYYRTKYYSTKTETCSQASESISGAGLAIRNILTVAEVKARYLFGVDFTNDAGEVMPDSTFEHYILQAVRWFEREVNIPILPTSIIEKHDYYREDQRRFIFIALDYYPVISIEEFRVQYPSGTNIVVYPAEWLRLQADVGHLEVVPTAGTISELLIGQGGSFLPAVYNGQDYLPQLYEIEYTAGFAEGRVPRDILDVIGMFASLGPFNVFGDLIAGAGIANLSLSMDGLSQSIGTTSSATNAGYGSRIIQYLKQIKDQIPKIRKHYKRVGGLVVS